jgi:CheY-like chemotaxis protein
MLMKNGVMIVDDDEGVRSVAEDILTGEGMSVVSVSSGSECIERLVQGFQGVILLDVMMPEMDGWQALREIVDRGLLGGIRICMLTGVQHPRSSDEYKLKEYLADYVTKPFTPAVLIDIVQEQLDW